MANSMQSLFDRIEKKTKEKMMKIKIKLEDQLKKSGISANTLAELTGLSQTSISLFKQNKTNGIRYTNILKICKALKCKIEDIIECVFEKEDEAPKKAKGLKAWFCGK